MNKLKLSLPSQSAFTLIRLLLSNARRSCQGFTLIEAVIAIVIIGVIGVIMSDILTRAFDNTQKTNLISNVQQNGQSALSSLEDTIRYAEFVCVGGKDSDSPTAAELVPNTIQQAYYQPVLVVFSQGKFIRYRIVPQTPTKINGYVSEDFPPAPPSDQPSTYLCTSESAAVNSRKVTNDAMLSVKRGTITLLSSPTNPAAGQAIGTSKVSISVLFAMGADAKAGTNAENQIGQNNEIVFQTTAQFR